jgi:hypothetical protein
MTGSKSMKAWFLSLLIVAPLWAECCSYAEYPKPDNAVSRAFNALGTREYMDAVRDEPEHPDSVYMDVYAGHAEEGVVTPLEELDKLFYGALGEMYYSWDWTCSPSGDTIIFIRAQATGAVTTDYLVFRKVEGGYTRVGLYSYVSRCVPPCPEITFCDDGFIIRATPVNEQNIRPDDKDQGIFMARKFFYKDKRDVCFFMSGREDYDFFSCEMETSR